MFGVIAGAGKTALLRTLDTMIKGSTTLSTGFDVAPPEGSGNTLFCVTGLPHTQKKRFPSVLSLVKHPKYMERAEQREQRAEREREREREREQRERDVLYCTY